MTVERDWTRRDILKAATAGGLASVVSAGNGAASEPATADPDRIRRENEHPGTREWMTTNVRIEPADQVSQPMDRGLCLPDERPARRNDLYSRQHESRHRPSCSRSIGSASTRATADA